MATTTESYPRLVQAFVPDVEAGAALRIRRAGEEMWRREASERRPKIGDAAAEFADGDVRVTWSADAVGEQEPECWAQWSGDRGRTWHALGVGLRGGSAVLDGRGLPAGAVRIRLLLSDGFHTAVSRTLNVKVPPSEPAASILSPRDGQIVAVPGSVRLWGAASDAHGAPVPDEAARWLVDGDEVATGLDAFVPAPKAGRHRATLVVKTRDGSSEITAEFTTVDLPEERDED